MHIVYILCMYLLNFVNLLLACWILLEEIRKGWKLQALVQSQNGVYIKPWAVRWWVWIKDLSHSEFGDVEAQLDPWEIPRLEWEVAIRSMRIPWQSMAIYGNLRISEISEISEIWTWDDMMTLDEIWVKIVDARCIVDKALGSRKSRTTALAVFGVPAGAWGFAQSALEIRSFQVYSDFAL